MMSIVHTNVSRVVKYTAPGPPPMYYYVTNTLQHESKTDLIPCCACLRLTIVWPITMHFSVISGKRYLLRKGRIFLLFHIKFYGLSVKSFRQAV